MFLAAVLVVGLFTGEGDFTVYRSFSKQQTIVNRALVLSRSTFSHAKDARKSHCSIEQFLSHRSCFVWPFCGSDFVFTAVLLCAVYGAAFVRVQLQLQFRVRGLLEDIAFLPQVFRRQCFSTSSLHFVPRSVIRNYLRFNAITRVVIFALYAYF